MTRLITDLDIIGGNCQSAFAVEVARALAPHMTVLADATLIDKALLIEYARFLVLKVYMRDVGNAPRLSASIEIDGVWHQHMLRPVAYANACYAVMQCGVSRRQRVANATDVGACIIAHTPKETPGYERRYTLALQSYQDVFGVGAPSLHWPEYVGADQITVFVKNLEGKTLTLHTSKTTTVEYFKKQVSKAENYTVSECKIRLIHAGKQLEDGRRLDEYGIQRDSTIHAVLRLCGC